MSLVSVASNGTQKDLPGLLEKLNYRDSLHQWDVMVAYSEDTVNSILQTSHAKVMEQLKNDGKPDFFQSIRLEVDEIKPISLDTSTAKTVYTLSLDEPALKILNDNCSISLTFKIYGETVDSKGEKGQFGKTVPTYFRSVQKIYAVQCGLNDGELRKKAAELPPPKDQEPDQFPPPIDIEGSDKQVGLVLNLGRSLQSKIFTLKTIQKDGKDIQIEDPPARSETMIAQLNIHLTEAGIAYHLGGISRVANPGPDVFLVPRRFVMTSVSTPEQSAIMFWINVQGTKQSGMENRQQFNLCFGDPPNDIISPIPRMEGVNACVMISRAALTDLFLQPQFHSQGFDGFEVADELVNQSAGGIGFRVMGRDESINVSRWHDDPESYDAFSFSTKEPKTDFTLEGSNASGKATYKASTTFHHDSGLWDDMPSRHTKVEMQFKSSCGGSWKSSKDSVQLELTYERNFALHIDLTHNEGIQALTSDTTVPNDLKNLAVQVNVLKFELQALNYFLTTNLIFPGQHVFEGRQVLIPRDMTILGVITKPDPAIEKIQEDIAKATKERIRDLPPRPEDDDVAKPNPTIWEPRVDTGRP